MPSRMNTICWTALLAWPAFSALMAARRTSCVMAEADALAGGEEDEDEEEVEEDEEFELELLPETSLLRRKMSPAPTAMTRMARVVGARAERKGTEKFILSPLKIALDPLKIPPGS